MSLSRSWIPKCLTIIKDRYYQVRVIISCARVLLKVRERVCERVDLLGHNNTYILIYKLYQICFITFGRLHI